MRRPPEVMERANKAWNEALSRHLSRGKSYAQSVRIAQSAYNQVLRNYDRKHRSHS